MAKKDKKYYQKSYYVALFGFAVMTCLALVSLLNEYQFQNQVSENMEQLNQKYSYPNITFEGVSFDQKNQILGIISELDDGYINLANSVEFTVNSTKVGIYCGNDPFAIGCNYGNDIMINAGYTDDYCMNRLTICHELLHSAVSKDKEYEESLVENLAGKEVCYPTIKCPEMRYMF